MGRLTFSAEPWMSCDECFEAVDGYVEMLLAEAPDSIPGLRAHLAACSACLEECRSLLLLAAADAGVDPGRALERLGNA
ncbi:hypothetical protein BIU82_05600 [Arthrobacter sp. SW1]|nr:hypothetical protein BIU82_05600 [Arthrobacter sp. SW1]